MLEDLDKADLELLGDIDKERLTNILTIIAEKKIRFPVAELTEKMPSDKAMVSKILKGKIKIPDKFYSTFIKTFDSQKVASNGSGNSNGNALSINKEKYYMETIADLSAANKEAYQANRLLAENQKELIAILKIMHKPIADAAKGIQPNVSETLQPYLNKIAENGVPERWGSMDEGLLILGKLLVSGEMTKQE